jgi:hypothetical protein
MTALNLLYDVGSKDESPERTGFAHLFEHLMFGGSVNIPDYYRHNRHSCYLFPKFGNVKMNFLVVIDVHRHYLTGGQGQCRTNGTAYPAIFFSQRNGYAQTGNGYYYI